MSEADRQLIRDTIELWNDGDREALVQSSHPEARIHSGLTNSTFEGHEGIRRWMAEIDEQFDSWKVTLDEFRDAPDGRLVVLGSVKLHGRASGVDMTQPLGWVYLIEQGRIREFWTYPDSAEALRTVGLE